MDEATSEAGADALRREALAGAGMLPGWLDNRDNSYKSSRNGGYLACPLRKSGILSDERGLPLLVIRHSNPSSPTM